MWYEPPTDLNSIFFSSLDKYEELIAPTGDENFDKFSKRFYRKNLAQRKQELVRTMKISATKRALLEDFKSNISDYEMRASEHNWPYQTIEERERNLSIYNFLCANLNTVTRKITLNRLTKEYFEAKNELIAIESVSQDESRKRKLSDLKMADMFYRSLERTFLNYLKAHPTAEFAKKYNLSPRTYNRDFFDSHIKEIKSLNPRRSQEPSK